MAGQSVNQELLSAVVSAVQDTWASELQELRARIEKLERLTQCEKASEMKAKLQELSDDLLFGPLPDDD